MRRFNERAVRIRGGSVVLILSALLHLGGSAHAQLVTGTIVGTVTDESRAVLPGVTVTITSAALPGGPETWVTDPQGRYRFTGLNPGTYTLTVILAGFGNYTEELRVSAGGTVERNVRLTVGTLAESITVTGQSPVIDTRNAAMSATATLEVMENLPTARTLVTDYVQVMPGVAAANPGGYNENVIAFGSRQGEMELRHDGVMTNTQNSGNNGYMGGDPDAVEEVQLTAVGASAEFAGASGGVLNVVSKSGTNNFQGDAGFYLKSDRFQSRPIKLDCNCPDGTTGFHMKDMRDYSAHLGGPIARDRLWFFTGFFYQRYTYSEPGNWPEEAKANFWGPRTNTKLTWQATDTTRVTGFLKTEPWGGYGTGPSRSVTYEASTENSGVYGYPYGAEVNRTFGGNTVLTVRVGGMINKVPNRPLTDDRTTPSRTDNFTGIVSQGVELLSIGLYDRHEQAVKLDRYIARSRVTHTLRGGFQHQRTDAVRRQAYPSGVQYYDFGGVPDYALFRAPSVQAADYTQAGGWGENQMTIGDRLTVMLGLRFDHVVGGLPDAEAVDTTLQPTGSTIAGPGDMFTWNIWSPRAGVNVKLTADGRTVLRGTYSRVHRQIWTNEIDPLHPGIAPITEARYDPATGTYSRIVSVTDPRANIRIDPGFKAPTTNAFSIGVDRQLRSQLARPTNYVFKDSWDLTGWRDIGGVYGQSTAVLPDGRSLTVFPLLNRTSDRLFQYANPSGWFDTYHGWTVGIDKRLANRWQAQANLTLSQSHGLRPTGILGRDPNDLTNATGRITDTDRPVLFNANAMYDIPGLNVRVSGQYQDISQRPLAPQAFVVLPQGRRAINIEEPGAFRAARVRLLSLRFNKYLFQQGRRRLELFVNVNNVLQNKSPQAGFGGSAFFTLNYFSPNYGEPTAFVQPRHVYMGARALF
jgi:hypothetical protein